MRMKRVAALACIIILIGTVPTLTQPCLAVASVSYENEANQPITVGEYAELRYNNDPESGLCELMEKIEIVDDTITDDSPDYVKLAFLSGLIQSEEELSKQMTREEAAIRLVSASDCVDGFASCVKTSDYAAISPEKLDAVGYVINFGIIPIVSNKFEPKKLFTVAQAKKAIDEILVDKLLGMFYPEEISDTSKIVVKKNYSCLTFPNQKFYEDYIERYVCPRVGGLEITDEHQRFDVGYGIIELKPDVFGVRYTFKNDICNVDNFDSLHEQPTYGVDCYKSEPRELKPSEAINLTMQPDSTHKKLYKKIDPVLKKIIKPNMTQKQKVKEIHDYVVKRIAYSGTPTVPSVEEALEAFETKKGVCANYCSLFYYMCRRANIPVKILDCYSINHAWNIVYINKKWLHVDTTWDDYPKQNYNYFLKDTKYMMKTRNWYGFGYPEK